MEKERWRLVPCPAYDVAGTEEWLAEMAREGWQLTEDGFFLGLAKFRAAAPAEIRYRLDAAPKGTGLWSENGGEPGEDAQGLYADLGWTYTGIRGPFHIYCSGDPAAPELHTDPAVEAQTLNVVKARQRETLLESLFWLVLYPLFFLRGQLLLTVVTDVGTGRFLLLTGLVLWVLVDNGLRLRAYRTLQKRLQAGEPPPRLPRRTALYYGRTVAKCSLLLLCVVLLLGRASDVVLDEDKVALQDYRGEVPFATLRDLAGPGAHDYHSTMQSMDYGKTFNAVKEWSDLLSPRCIQWAEHAAVTMADGRVLDGGLYIDYYKTASPWIAQQLWEGYCRKDLRDKWYEPLDTPDLPVDQVAVYTRVRIPCLLFRKGDVVVRAIFYQTSPEPPLPLQTWAGLLVESIS